MSNTTWKKQPSTPIQMYLMNNKLQKNNNYPFLFLQLKNLPEELKEVFENLVFKSIKSYLNNPFKNIWKPIANG